MRLTVAIVFFATLVVAHPQAHDEVFAQAVAKRHSSIARSLVPLENTIEAHKARFNGSHELKDVPTGLVYPGDSESDLNPALYGSYDDSWEIPASLKARDGEDETPVDVDAGTTTDIDPRADGKKWGIAWTNEVVKGLSQLKCDQSIGIYNWGPQKWSDFDKYKCPFIPHLHSDRKLEDWKKYVKRGYGKGYMMAPNEVNLASQAKMTPGHCAWLMRTYMMPLLQKTPGDGGYKMIGPSCANGPSALEWYDEFKRTAPDVWNAMEATNVHFYGTDANKAIEWITLFYTRYNKPVWVTEFACHSFSGKGSCNKSQAEAYMKKIIAFCKSTSWCKAYFLYGSYVNSRAGVSSSNAMFSNPSGTLTSLGKTYVSS
jgi:hypothetical protein